MNPETIGTIAGGAFVAINVGGFWLREWRKHRTWRTNGNDLKEIKNDVKDMKGKQGEQGEKMAAIAQSVDDQKKHCQTTVSRVSRAMDSFNKELLDMAKNRRK